MTTRGHSGRRTPARRSPADAPRRHPAPPLRPAFGSAVGAASPLLVTAVVAAVGASGVLALDLGGLPAAFLALLLAQFVGVVVARELEMPRWRQMWWMAIACTAMLLPALALQASASRTPFVSLGRGSAGALVWLTLGCAVLLAAMFAWTVSVSTDEPGRAVLLWAPAALLVLAVLGTPGPGVDARAGLLAMAAAFAVAALAVIVGELSPGGSRMPIVAGAFGLLAGLLWLAGRTPDFPPGQGRVAAATEAFLLLLTAGSLLAMPLGALAGRRLAETAAAPPAGPPQQAKRTGPRRLRR